MIVKLLTEHQLNRRLQRLVRVYTCQNATLLEISCHSSIIEYKHSFIIQVQKVMKDIQTPYSGIERYSMVSVNLQETKYV